MSHIVSMVCNCGSPASAAAEFFDAARARRELADYHRRGPGESTRRLLAALRVKGTTGTLLDVGAGTGILSLELLRSGMTQATCVDLARESLQVAREEAQRQGLSGRITWREGDIVELGAGLPQADLVTLDRVVCCYPACRPLLEAAARHSRRWLALSFPRDRWYVRLGIWLENLWLQARGGAFRSYFHPAAAMDTVLREGGLVPVHEEESAVWQVAVYVRDDSQAD